MGDMRWLSITRKMLKVENNVLRKEQPFYIAYGQGSSLVPLEARRVIEQDVAALDGWVFDWNGADGPESPVFNFGVALPAL